MVACVIAAIIACAALLFFKGFHFTTSLGNAVMSANDRADRDVAILVEGTSLQRERAAQIPGYRFYEGSAGSINPFGDLRDIPAADLPSVIENIRAQTGWEVQPTGRMGLGNEEDCLSTLLAEPFTGLWCTIKYPGGDFIIETSQYGNHVTLR